jgi:hypothetical protein
MLRTKLLALVAVTTLLASGVAGAVPADGASPNDGQSDGPPVDLPELGPPSDLPDAVPDFVSDVHDAVRNHVDEGVDNLGDRISGLTPGES